MSYRLILEGLADARHEVTEKRNEYRKYIDTHRAGVVHAYNNFMVPCLKGIRSRTWQEALRQAGINVMNHDLSKYEEVEFEAYRRHYYPTSAELDDTSSSELNENLYQAAWKHHHQVNLHHPEHWYEDMKSPTSMPPEYIIEMLCDWWSVGNSKGNTVFDWWESSKTKSDERKKMTDFTLNNVEMVLEQLKGAIYRKEIDGAGWI